MSPLKGPSWAALRKTVVSIRPFKALSLPGPARVGVPFRTDSFNYQNNGD